MITVGELLAEKVKLRTKCGLTHEVSVDDVSVIETEDEGLAREVRDALVGLAKEAK